MRIRIRFSKHEPPQYIGHLDVMRYFQKAIRRADLPVKYSEGFSPHILMSFASPLGVGKTSDAEYFDLDMQAYVPCAEVLSRLQAEMAPGLNVNGASYVREDKKHNAMRVIAAASYLVSFPETVPVFTQEQLNGFLEQQKIEVLRKTKKKEEVTDIRPWIYDCKSYSDGLFLMLSAGSIQNLKPELVVDAIAELYHVALPDTGIRICRKELFAEDMEQKDQPFVSLLECGSIPEDKVEE